MDYFERTLLRFLSGGKVKMEIANFDMKGFSKAIDQEMKYRLDMIAHIVYEDESISSPAEKFAMIKQLFDQEFYDKK